MHLFQNPCVLGEQVSGPRGGLSPRPPGVTQIQATSFRRFVSLSFIFLHAVKKSGFMQRAVISVLNGAKTETSSGHTPTCPPHFPQADSMSTAVPFLQHCSFFFSSNSLSISTSPSHSSSPSLYPSPARSGLAYRDTPPPLPQHTHIHTLSIVSSAQSRFAL